MPSPRRAILAAAGPMLLAGCLAEEMDPEGGSNDDDDTDDEETTQNEPCEPLDLPLVDEPPNEPERPPSPDLDEIDEWDDLYLGDAMDEATDTAFERINIRYREPVVDPVAFGGDGAYQAALFTTREEFDEALEPVGDDSDDRVAAIDFDEEVVVAVLSGLGSSSVSHQWVRVDEYCDELHLHGYYRQPYIQTDDVAPRVSGVIIEKPTDDDLDQLWVSLTVDTDTRINVPSDGDVHVVNGDTDDDDSDSNRIDLVQVVQADREYDGDWRRDDTDDTGIAVYLTDEDQVRAIVEPHEDVDRFITGTDFGEDAVFYLESAGPDACHRKIDVTDVEVVTDEDRSFVRGTANVIDDSDAGGGCAEVVTFPGALVRIQSEVDLATGEFDIIDGWGDQATIEAMSMGEFAAE